jgi:hypothetical protein
MPLSNVQKGAVGQFAFLATALVTGKGQVEVYSPVADNEGRDAEVRRHLKPAPGISIQVKVGFSSISEGGRAKYLAVRFELPEDRVQEDPRLWYFFAYYDQTELRFHDPVFLIPSHVFNVIGRQAVSKGKVWFGIVANLAPGSHDRWTPFRVAPKDLGDRLLEIIDKTGLTATSDVPLLPADALWLGLAAPRAGRKLGAVSADSKYDLIRNAVLEKDSVSAFYKGHLRLLSPFVLGTKAGEPHLLGYQFGGSSHEPLQPEGSPKNLRCLRVAELTEVRVLPGIWHTARQGKGFQHCVDQVDVSAGRPSRAKHRLRRAA